LADERAARVAAYLRSRGLVARPAWLNNVLAPLGDMPGNVSQETMRAGLLRGRGPAMNVRRTRVEMGAITRVSPLTGISQGHEADWRFGGPALLMATTRRGMRFSWAMNAPGSDSAHTAVVGKTGSGKSVLLALMAAQFLRYAGARVAVFDRGRSFMVPCLALGGDWIELGAGGKGVQPLRAVDRPEEMNWAHEWVMRALKVRGLATTPQTEMAVSEALQLVAEAPEERRTLSLLHAYLGQNNDARSTLAHYLAGQGPYGELFDGVVASYGDASVIGVETRDITQLEDAAPLAVTAMFRAIQRDRLVGDSPKLVMVDEAWSLMGNEHFSDVIESWAREMRKLKTALVLATQSVHDLAGDKTKVIFDQIANRIYLPHAEAMRPQTRALYEAAGLTEEQVQLLSVARPKGEYLLQTEELTRLVDIRLEGEALAICGASTPADHARARALLGQSVQPGGAFLGEWLAQSTRDWLAAQGVALLRAAE
jgi:type IV secretion system protein TrbE